MSENESTTTPLNVLGSEKKTGSEACRLHAESTETDCFLWTMQRCRQSRAQQSSCGQRGGAEEQKKIERRGQDKEGRNGSDGEMKEEEKEQGGSEGLT